MTKVFGQDSDIVMVALTQGQVMLVDPQDAEIAMPVVGYKRANVYAP